LRNFASTSAQICHAPEGNKKFSKVELLLDVQCDMAVELTFKNEYSSGVAVSGRACPAVVFYCFSAGVYVCVRERERQRERETAVFLYLSAGACVCV